MGILKNQLEQSSLGLKGSTPVKRKGALPTSQAHVRTKLKSQTAEHSTLDLDGQTPEKYTDNLPQ